MIRIKKIFKKNETTKIHYHIELNLINSKKKKKNIERIKNYLINFAENLIRHLFFDADVQKLRSNKKRNFFENNEYLCAGWELYTTVVQFS